MNFQVVLQGSDDIASRAIELLKETFTSLGPKLRASQVCVLVHHENPSHEAMNGQSGFM